MFLIETRRTYERTIREFWFGFQNFQTCLFMYFRYSQKIVFEKKERSKNRKQSNKEMFSRKGIFMKYIDIYKSC